jgi:NADPH-dependent 7-cyano-7-deazaguanine reductase QueF-like protein
LDVRRGTSVITETISKPDDARRSLRAPWLEIEVEGNTAIVRGGQLTGATSWRPDLRASASVIAGLMAEGATTIDRTITSTEATSGSRKLSPWSPYPPRHERGPSQGGLALGRGVEIGRSGVTVTELTDSPLGRAAKYPERHDPGILFSIERATQRSLLGFEGVPPFGGVDLWTAYELSWLNRDGKPEVAIATFAVPADSPRLVESKSVKLYLTGFNLTHFDGPSDVAATLARDLSHAGGSAIDVTLTPPRADGALPLAELPGECLDELPIAVAHYEPAPEALAAAGPVRSEACAHACSGRCAR